MKYDINQGNDLFFLQIVFGGGVLGCWTASRGVHLVCLEQFGPFFIRNPFINEIAGSIPGTRLALFLGEGVVPDSSGAASADATPSDAAAGLGLGIGGEVSVVASLTAAGAEAAVAAASAEASVSVAGFAGASSFCLSDVIRDGSVVVVIYNIYIYIYIYYIFGIKYRNKPGQPRINCAPRTNDREEDIESFSSMLKIKGLAS